MRFSIAVIAVGCFLAAAYLAQPLYAAWNIHEAIRTGDIATLERLVQWPGVRQSLKQSIRGELTAMAVEQAARSGSDRPSPWQRFTTWVGSTMTDRFVDTTFTPQGLVKAYADAGRVRPRRNSGPLSNPDEGSLAIRLLAFAGQVRAMAYLASDRFRIEVADRDVADRHYVGILSRHPDGWQLAELRVTNRRGGDQRIGTSSLAASTADATR